MTTKKTPADVLTLRKIVQEQAVEIAELSKKLQGKTTDLENAQNINAALRSEWDEAKTKIDQIHDLIDACPGTIPRSVERKTSWGGIETKDRDVIVRLASWLGATK